MPGLSLGLGGGGAVSPLALFADGSPALQGEDQGLALDFLVEGGAVKVLDTGTPANNEINTPFLDWAMVNDGMSPKQVLNENGQFEWTAHNLFLNSATPATQNVTLIVGATYTVKVTGAGSMAGSSGASGTATEGGPATFVATGTTGTFTKTGDLDTIQINRGTVPTTYMATTSAARFAVPQEYDGSAYWYGLSEPSASNQALYASDLTNAAWVKSGISAAKTATGPDGVANSASTLTASGADGTALQSITSASAARISACSIKRRTGTGNIYMTQDNGATWTDITSSISGSWSRVSIPSATVTNPVVGFKIETSGDEIDVWVFQQELGTVATSPIPTFGTTVTRAADNINVATSLFPYLATAGTFIVEGSSRLFSAVPIVHLYKNSSEFLYMAIQNRTLYVVSSGSNVADLSPSGDVLDVFRTKGAAWAENDFVAVSGGGTPATDGAGAVPSAATVFHIGANASTAGHYKFRKILYLPRRMSNADLITRTI